MKIILVEDNDNTATLTELYMTKMGFADEIDRTYRIKPFEHLVKLNKYDLAIIDYHLQAFDAPEFVKALRNSEKNKNTPIIIVSHELDKWEQDEINKMGLHYVRRPDDYNLFVGLIKNVLRKMN